MPYTPEQGIEYWKQQNPPPVYVQEGEEIRELTPEEYEAMAQDRGPMLADSANAQEAHEADIAEGQGILDRVQALETTAARLKDPSIPFTNQQIRNVMAEHMLVTSDSIRYIHKHSSQWEGTP